MQVAKKCTPRGTRCAPNNMMPRNVASRKNAVSTSYPSSGPSTLPAAADSALQFVPNSKLITRPETTPRPKDTAKILSQKRYRLRYAALPVVSHSNSSIMSQLASPIVKAGNRIWNEIVNANCSLASNNGSSMRAV